MPQVLNEKLIGLGPKTEKAKTAERMGRTPAKAIGRHLQSVYSNDLRARLGIDAGALALTQRGGAGKVLGRIGQEVPMYYEPALQIARTLTPDVDPQTRTNVVGTNATMAASNAIKDALQSLLIQRLGGNTPAGKVAASKLEGWVNVITDPLLSSGVNKFNEYMTQPDSSGKTKFDKIPYLTELLTKAAKSGIGDSYYVKDGFKSLMDPSETGDYYLGDNELLLQLMKAADPKNVPPTKITDDGRVRIDNTKPMSPLQKRNAGAVNSAQANQQKMFEALASPQGKSILKFMADMGRLDVAVPEWTKAIQKPLPSAGKPYKGTNAPPPMSFRMPSANEMRNSQ